MPMQTRLGKNLKEILQITPSHHPDNVLSFIERDRIIGYRERPNYRRIQKIFSKLTDFSKFNVFYSIDNYSSGKLYAVQCVHGRNVIHRGLTRISNLPFNKLDNELPSFVCSTFKF